MESDRHSHLCHIGNTPKMRQATVINNELIESAAAYDRRFYALPSLPMPDVEQSLAELDRLIGHPVVRGIMIYADNDEFTIDVMASACGHDWAELEPAIVNKLVDDQTVRVLGLEGLLLTKEGMRDKDRADAEMLRRLIAALRAEA